MVFKFEIFNHSEFRIHKTYIFSKATVFNITTLFFSFLLPFLLIEASRDFWITEIENFQTPKVNFLNQVLLRVNFENDFGAWSTLSNYKSQYIKDETFINCNMAYRKVQLFKNDLVLGEIVDEGVDFNITVPTNGKKVVGIEAIFVLDYKIQDITDFQTQALACLEKSYMVPGSQLIGYGTLKLNQKFPLPSALHYNYSKNVLQTDSVTPNYMVMKSYLRRNFTVLIDDETKLFSWTPITNNDPVNNFNLLLRLRFTPQFVRYGSTFCYSLKFAWLQYVAVAFIFYLFFDRVRSYIFSRRILATMVIKPKKVDTVNKAIH